jgi:phage gpG-like protein
MMQNAIKLTNHIKSGKLSGQVLKVRTGRLRNSIHNVNTENENGFKSIVKTDVKYAAVHEYGFSGSVSVKAHMRTIKQAFGKSIAPTTILIGGHSRSVNMPERSFMRSALNDIKDNLFRDINEAVKRIDKK